MEIKTIPKTRRYCTMLKPLVLDVKNMKEDFLPAYNKELVDRILKEIEELKDYILQYANLIEKYNEDDSDDEEEDGERDNESKKEEIMLLYRTLIGYFERNQQALLIYTYHRMRRIKEFFWKYEKVPDDLESHMSEGEREFFSKYRKIVEFFPEDLGLMQHESGKPPICDLFVWGHVEKDLGMVESMEGSFFFKKGSVINMRRRQSTDFLKRGILKEIHM